jgi:uncharacterized membrane protein YdbT with pleckstrin-like domain
VSYPSLEELLESKEDSNLFEFKRSPYSILPKVLLFLLTSVIVFLANAKFYRYNSSSSYLLRTIVIFPIFIFLDIVRTLYDDLYVISIDQIERKQGRISFKFINPSVNYQDIRGVTVEQTFFGRIFNYGNVLLGTAGQDEEELIIEGVDEPHKLAELIQGLRKNSESY